MRRLFRKVGTTALVLGLFVGMGMLMHAVVPDIAHAAYETPEESTWANSLVMWIGNVLAQIINFIGDAIGSLTLVIIEVIVVNVLSYNNFSSSSIVTLGWTLTRDMVNMFAVIVLLILAVKTMVGQGSSAWQQHLPRFFLGIVFANFSRTICGLAVDASQIVMMTFVNALMSIAAGNFAQLMVMPQATTYSSATFQGASEAGITLVTLASNIANAYVKLMVQVAVMIVILLLAVAFIWRIIMLWIAFIMAPFAGFSWGSMDIIKWLGRVWNEWVQGFVPPLILGPMLAFFLYLALAASSNGHLAKAEAFPEPEERTTYGQITLEIFESTNFTGLLIAIVFLLMGIRESAKIASKMGGLAAMALNEKTGRRALSLGRKISGGALALPVTGARVGSQLAGKAGGMLGRSNMFAGSSPRLNAFLQRTGNLTQKAAGVATRGLQVAESPLESSLIGGKKIAKRAGNIVSAAGAATGSDLLLSAGSSIDARLHGFDEKEKKAAKDRVSHMTDAQRVSRLMKSATGTGAISNDILADAKVLRGELFTNKDFAKALEKEVGKEKFDEIVQSTLSDFDKHEHDRPIDKEAWNKARSQYADLYAKVDKSKAEKFIDSEDFNGRLLRSQAAADETVLNAMGRATSKYESGKKVSKLDELNRGTYGRSKTTEASAHLTTTDVGKASVIQAIIEGKTDVSNLAKEQIDAEAKAAAKAGRPPGVTAASVQQQFVTNVMQTQSVENIGRAFENGQVSEGQLNDAMFDSSRNANADKAIQALAQSKADFSKMNAATQSQIQAQLAAMEAAGGRISIDDANAIRQKLLGAGKTIPDIIPGVDTNPATNPSMNIGRDERMKVQQLMKADPSSVAHMQDAIRDAVVKGARNDFSKTIVDGLSKEDFNKLAEMMRKETDAGKKAAIKDAMSTIGAALRVHETTASSADEIKRLRGLRSSYNAAERYMT